MLQNSWSLRKLGKNSIRRGLLNGIMSLENVSVKFGNLMALQDVHFKVDKGEIVFITGPSGAGKTTLLHLLGGGLSPSQGKVYSPIHDSKSSCFIAPIFQDLRLIPHYSLEANLMASFDPNFYRDRGEFLSDMIELSKILGIKDRLHLKASKANGGLKQQIAFLRAILSRPDIILADEPTTSLDYENAKKIYDIFNLYNIKRGLTVVWASHNKDLVKKFSGRIVHLEKGRLIYSGHACFI